MLARHLQRLTRKDFEKAQLQAEWRHKAMGCAASARRNLLQNARLGLIAGKKMLPLAVSRNRFKRLAREVFKRHRESLLGLDVIIVARVPARNMRRNELRASLEQLISGLTACVNSSSC